MFGSICKHASESNGCHEGREGEEDRYESQGQLRALGCFHTWYDLGHARPLTIADAGVAVGCLR